ncbi:hypothetical protein KBY66_08220 [Synechococcus sp. Tobar12-5m-g]|uniref:recombinase family protein n=1 Tax=unclassified Synechococcus TaxID=2626047 RepID=UPI0020CF7B29|nr:MULTISPECIES: recombinase family protein [unclassified Synechococcus]MCP9772610.1 hypothetical protein [Synechococcus sp. Tobar12-5m-g]MCP9873534.1 hypothetical protein [Synechococcus sp. Cruz CV-v-12]
MRVGLARVSTTKRAQDVSIEGQVAQLEQAGLRSGPGGEGPRLPGQAAAGMG